MRSIFRLAEQVIMHLTHHRRVDGIWVGVASTKGDDYILCRVESALALIKEYDPVRYQRIQRDIKQIWVSPLIGAWGEFIATYHRCDLDAFFAENRSPELIASVIVHEATHGHPCLAKLGYPEPLRHRMEKICERQQLAFARKLPHAKEIIRDLEARATVPEAYWSVESFRARRPAAELAAGRAVGIPDWLIKFAQAIRNGRLRIRSVIRKLLCNRG